MDNPGDWLPNGLDMADVNGDGDPDFLVNCEWTGRVRVVFHPGRGLAPDRPWPAVDVGRFPNAENAAFGDLDADGIVDIVVVQGIEHHADPSAVRILWGRSPPDPEASLSAYAWEDGGMLPEGTGLGTTWTCRWQTSTATGSRTSSPNRRTWFTCLGTPVGVVRARGDRQAPRPMLDLNGDGRVDIVGAAIHRDGRLPQDVAAVWWLEQGLTGWVAHVIKWGSGFLGLGTFNGEKWDQLFPLDVDGDGDLDLVANVEEMNRLRSILAVVWFANPGRAGAPGG
ncbi:MAG: FG-GAP repeat domain-containing protein [Candidatus Bipolaricaulis sp.]